jgi:hypothetical protein
MPSDVDASADPDSIMLEHGVEKSGESGDAPRPTGEPQITRIVHAGSSYFCGAYIAFASATKSRRARRYQIAERTCYAKILRLEWLHPSRPLRLLTTVSSTRTLDALAYR